MYLQFQCKAFFIYMIFFFSCFSECERLAISILGECYSRDKALAHRLLVRETPQWGKLTLFKLAIV